MSSSGNKKTIQINRDFFKIGKKGLNAASSEQSQTQKKERKPVNKTLKHNTIKKELVKRIQQLKQQERLEESKRETHDNRSLTSIGGDGESEFADSIKYLQTLAQNKKVERAKERRIKRPPSAVEQPQETISHGGGSGSATPKNKTMKMSHLFRDYVQDYGHNRDDASALQVQVDLPPELNMDIYQWKHPISPDSLQLTAPLTLNRESNTPSISQQNIPITPKQYSYAPAPPYSNLKGSVAKPTFRQWNKTRKNVPESHQAALQTKIHSSPATPISVPTSRPTPVVSTLTDRERKLAELKQRFQSNPVEQSTLEKKPTEIMELKKFYSKSIDGQTTSTSGGRKRKTIKRTIKHVYTVGKSKVNRKVSVLVKNIRTRRNVQEAKKQLKNENLVEIKRYLKQHGMLKSGSSAPNDVLRAMYESAMLAGDVHNVNIGTKLHNYLEDTESS